MGSNIWAPTMDSMNGESLTLAITFGCNFVVAWKICFFPSWKRQLLVTSSSCSVEGFSWLEEDCYYWGINMILEVCKTIRGGLRVYLVLVHGMGVEIYSVRICLWTSEHSWHVGSIKIKWVIIRETWNNFLSSHAKDWVRFNTKKKKKMHSTLEEYTVFLYFLIIRICILRKISLIKLKYIECYNNNSQKW